MFKFAFGSDSKNEPSSDVKCSSTANADMRTLPSASLCRAWEVSLPEPLEGEAGIPDIFDVVELADGAVKLCKCAATQPESLAPQNSDLLAGSYEGGYKLWECATDLVAYMHRTLQGSLSGASVLEIGAGHALPAIFAAISGASHVTVADFNEDVLQSVTATNIRLNCPHKDGGLFRMIAGDWGGIVSVLRGDQFDVLLAAEVTYSLESLESLTTCVLDVLKPGGVAYVAGKTYYFGVGGGMRVFEKALNETAALRQIRIDVQVAEEIRDLKSNVREILKITKLA